MNGRLIMNLQSDMLSNANISMLPIIRPNRHFNKPITSVNTSFTAIACAKSIPLMLHDTLSNQNSYLISHCRWRKCVKRKYTPWAASDLECDHSPWTLKLYILKKKPSILLCFMVIFQGGIACEATIGSIWPGLNYCINIIGMYPYRPYSINVWCIYLHLGDFVMVKCTVNTVNILWV